MDNSIQWEFGSALYRLRGALKKYAPGTQWSIQLTESEDDNILNIFVSSEEERVKVRRNLTLSLPAEETDTTETHTVGKGFSIVIIEVGNAVRSSKG